MKPEIIPADYTLRPGRLSDLDIILKLDQKLVSSLLQEEAISVEKLRKAYQTPGFSLENSSRLVLDREHKLLALAEVWDLEQPPVQPLIVLRADPGLEQPQQILGRLIDWAENRCREVLNQVDPELRVAARVYSYPEYSSLSEALIAGGFQIIRYSFRMEIELTESIPDPDLPEGIRIRTVNPVQDLYDVFRIDDELFRDHFGYLPQDPEQAYQQFQYSMTGGEDYDPDLWFIAEENNQIVGICLCKKFARHDPESGWISSLGVRKPWRRQGIARALLRHSFQEFYRRGKSRVGLTVDAQSLTGALDLYHSVGMESTRRIELYEKVLRPGREFLSPDRTV
jgi:ribosomal protein S18 acetylase RimI-like enzyme